MKAGQSLGGHGRAAVHLDHVESDDARYTHHFSDGFVAEHADPLDRRPGNRREQLAGALRRDPARALGHDHTHE